MPDLTSPVGGAVFLDDPNFPKVEPFDRDYGRAGMVAPMPGPLGNSTYALGNNVIRASRFVPSRDMTITKLAIAVLTAAGVADTVDLAILSSAGVRLGSSGAIQPSVGGDLTTTGVKVYNLTASVRLVAKTVYYAAVCSGVPGGAAAIIAAMTLGTNGALGALFSSAAGGVEMESLAQAPPVPASVVFNGNAGLASVAPVIAVREA